VNTPNRKRSGRAAYIAVFAGLIAVDQAIKYLVASHMKLGESIAVIGDFLHIRYLVNYGISFSLFEGHPSLVIAIQTAIFVVLGITFIVLYRGMAAAVQILVGFAITLAGGVGNLIDRYVHGYVIDYISVLSFPVWNFADMCIIGGCVLIALCLILDSIESTRRSNDS
jgi:signal peptidase II